MNEPGVSEADVIGLMAVGGQFGLAGVQAADTTVRLARGLLSPGMLLALAMADAQGRAVIGKMADLAFLQGTDSTAAAALVLGLDAVDLEVSAIGFMLADDGFFTDPFELVPLAELEAAGDVTVDRTITFTVEGDVSFEGAMIAAGSTLVVEYLSNGMVRVSVRGDLRGGADLSSAGLDGISASAGPLAGVSWLVADAREASRLVVALGTSGAARGALAVAGVVPPVPLPQSVTVGYTPLSVSGSVSGGGATLASVSVESSGQVTFDETGRTYQVGIAATASSSLAGSVLNALPPDVQRQLPGEGVLPGGNLAEGGVGSSLSIRTDNDKDVQSISLSFEGSFGQGTGLSTSYASGQSTAGERATVTVTLGRDDLEALGPDGRRVLDALGQNRPDLAVQALQDLGGEIVDRAGVSVDRRDYLSVSGGVAGKGAGTGASVGAGVTIETAKP